MIKNQFPAISDNLFSKMYEYQDRDMMQRMHYVNNIPYLRGLPEDIIRKLIYHLKM